jgi:hypothetical protein
MEAIRIAGMEAVGKAEPLIGRMGERNIAQSAGFALG